MISVLMPVYNAEKYICASVESVLNQTVSDLELIVIDDGSTDQTSEILNEYASKDSRMRVVKQINQGVGAARNHAVQEAKGEFLTFLDGDDIIAPNYLEVLVSLQRKSRADLVIVTYQSLREQSFSAVEQQYSVESCTMEECLHRYLRVDPRIGQQVWGKLYRRELFEHVRFPLHRYFEDTAVMYRLIMNADSVVVSDYDGYGYFTHEGSLTRQWTTAEFCTRSRVYYEMCSVIHEKAPAFEEEANALFFSGLHSCMIALCHE